MQSPPHIADIPIKEVRLVDQLGFSYSTKQELIDDLFFSRSKNYPVGYIIYLVGGHLLSADLEGQVEFSTVENLDGMDLRTWLPFLNFKRNYYRCVYFNYFDFNYRVDFLSRLRPPNHNLFPVKENTHVG